MLSEKLKDDIIERISRGVELELKIVFLSTDEKLKEYFLKNKQGSRSQHDSKLTIGMDVISYGIDINRSKVTINLLDISPAEKFKFIVGAYYKMVSGAIILCENQNPTTARSAIEILQTFQSINNKAHILFINFRNDKNIEPDKEFENEVMSLEKESKILYYDFPLENIGDNSKLMIYLCCSIIFKSIPLLTNSIIGRDLFEKTTHSVDSLFEKNVKFTFLVGAGISLDAPSNLPSGDLMGRKLIEIFSPKAYTDKLVHMENLRYELILQWIQQIFDKELHILDYFNYAINPNVFHMFLANRLLHGDEVITTNFDYLIERALKIKLKDTELDKINPIITKNDFIKLESEEAYVTATKKFSLYKIHGSKKNIIKNIDTSESIIATLDEIGKRRERRKIFEIEPYKRKIIEKVMFGSVLVIFGYSGSDVFDVIPMLDNMKGIKRILWIDHQNTDEIEIFKINWAYLNDNNSEFKHVVGWLRTDGKYDLFLIQGNTEKILKSSWLKNFIPTQNIVQNISEGLGKSPDFETWINKEFRLEQKIRIKFASTLFLKLGNPNNAFALVKEGIKLSQDIEDRPLLISFLIDLGDIFKHQGNYKDGLSQYEKAKELSIELNDDLNKSICLYKIGIIQMNQGELDSSLMNLQKALTLSEKNQDFHLNILILNKVAEIYIKKEAMPHSKEDYTDIKKVFSNLQKALKISMNIGDLYGKTLTLINLGRFENDQDKIREALQLRQYYR